MRHKNIKDAMKAAKKTGLPQTLEAQTIESVKVNISIRLDLEVLNWVKDEAKAHGLPYQTYINSLLTVAKNNGSIEDRMARIEQAIAKGKVG